LQPICVVAKGTDDVITEKKKKIDAAAVKTVNRMKPFPQQLAHQQPYNRPKNEERIILLGKTI
jgi:hypothetical protein